MMSTELVMAQYANTRGSRVNDPDLERYLREEYPGGMTVEALLAGTVRPNGGGRAALVRLAQGGLRGVRRGQPAPAPAGPRGGPRPRGGARPRPQGRGGQGKGPPHAN